MNIQSLLLNTFEGLSGVYPIHIIPTGPLAYGLESNLLVREYMGIHVVGTGELLSLTAGKHSEIELYLDKNGQNVTWMPLDRDPGGHSKIDLAIKFRSIELGEWCRDLITGSWEVALEAIEHLDLPFIYKNSTFDRFEQLGKGLMSKEIIQHYLSAVTYFAYTDFPEYIFDVYYRAFQGLVLARTGKFIHESSVLANKQPDKYRANYSMICRNTETKDQYECLNAIEEQIEELKEELRIAIEISDLPDYPPRDMISKLDEELLKLRSALF